MLVTIIIVKLGHHGRAFLVAQPVKNPAAVQETQVPFLGQEDPLENRMATHSSILAWRIPMDRGAWWTTVHGVTKSRTQLSKWALTHTHTHTHTQSIMEAVRPWNRQPTWARLYHSRNLDVVAILESPEQKMAEKASIRQGSVFACLPPSCVTSARLPPHSDLSISMYTTELNLFTTS